MHPFFVMIEFKGLLLQMIKDIDRDYKMQENDLSRDYVIKKLRFICNSYADILGIVILFGSYSRDEAHKTSDIDLYIEPKDLKMTSAKLWKNKRYREFEYALYDNFPCQFDLLSYGGKRDIANIRKTPLWKQIEKDGVTIYDQRAEKL